MIEVGVGRPVVEPSDWMRFTGFRALCDRCLIVFWPRAMAAARSLARIVGAAPRLPGAVDGLVADLGSSKLCVYQMCIGAPATAMAMEVLASSGVKSFVLFGGCGSIHPRARIYDLVLPTWGVREEGTSYHYLPPSIVPKPSPDLVEALARELRPVAKLLGVELHLGGVWSTDAPFRETVDKVEKYRGEGVLCVDMESTAAMTVAMVRGVRIGVVLVVMDELFGGEWVVYSDRERMARVEREALRTLLRVLAES